VDDNGGGGGKSTNILPSAVAQNGTLSTGGFVVFVILLMMVVTCCVCVSLRRRHRDIEREVRDVMTSYVAMSIDEPMQVTAFGGGGRDGRWTIRGPGSNSRVGREDEIMLA
jgi:hypothetical protein